jgi:hypothetical protein
MWDLHGSRSLTQQLPKRNVGRETARPLIEAPFAILELPMSRGGMNSRRFRPGSMPYAVGSTLLTAFSLAIMLMLAS